MDITDKVENLTSNIKILLEDLTYETKDGKHTIKIPKYVAWNGISLPTPLLFTISGDRFGKTVLFPSLVHDYLYDKQSGTDISRKKADDIFYDLLRDSNNGKAFSLLAWTTVRLFGFMDWKTEEWYIEGYDQFQRNVKVEEVPEDSVSWIDKYFFLFIFLYLAVFILFMFILIRF